MWWVVIEEKSSLIKNVYKCINWAFCPVVFLFQISTIGDGFRLSVVGSWSNV